MIYVYVAGGAMVAGFVQGLSGFAFSLVALSIWAWSLDPTTASLLALFGALLGQVIAAVAIRRPFDKTLLTPFLLGGLAGVPLGVWLVPHLDAALLKATVGTVLVVWAPGMLLSHRLAGVQRGGRVGDTISGAAGGVMAGIGGFAGAAPTLWTTVRGFPRDAQRAVIQNFNLVMLATAFAIHAARGSITAPTLPLMAVVAAAATVPVLLGSRIYAGLSDLAFRRTVLVLLTASGIAMLSSAIPDMAAGR
jgi:uncharacterized protein